MRRIFAREWAYL